MRKVIFIAALLVTASAAWGLPSNCTTGTNVYYISQSLGSDSNTQTQAKSKSTPWKHAPTQHSFTGLYTHTAGDCFIFYGTDTWNVGTTDYFVLNVGGNSATNIDYYGIDTSWPSTGWNRPIMDVQSSFPNTDAYHNATVFSFSVAYVTFDGFEIIHEACQATPTQTNLTLFATNGNDYVTVTNSYFHEFTTQLGGCGGGKVTNGSASGNNFAVWVYMSVSNDGGHGSFDHNVVDGTDGSGLKGYDTIIMDPATAAVPSYNVLHDICSGVAGDFNLAHDNLIYNFGYNANTGTCSVGGGACTIQNSSCGSGGTCNVFDCNSQGIHAHAIRAENDATVYNNVVHDVNDGVIKTNPTNGTMYYIFNNVAWNIGYPQFAWDAIDLCDNGGTSCSSGKVTVFNNSLQCVQNNQSSSACFRLENAANTLTIVNEHHVGLDTSGSLSGTNLATTFTTSNNVYQEQGTCAGCADSNTSPHFDQYTLSQNPVISPVASTNSTVGAGTTIPAGAPSAANSSTTYACTQGTTAGNLPSGITQVVCPGETANSRGSTPNAGAYQFVSPNKIPPAPHSAMFAKDLGVEKEAAGATHGQR